MTGAVFALALVWSCASWCVLALTHPGPHATDGAACTETGTGPARDTVPPAVADVDRSATVTTIMRLGDEPAEIARASLALARRAGPVLVVTRPDVHGSDLGLDADSVHRAGDPGEALRSAAAAARTDAVVVVSARAVPDIEACRSAAALLDEHTGWVVGHSSPFNRDRYASDRRELVSAQLRRRARSTGLVLWENDATVLRTDLLATYPPAPGQPWGAWLRDRAAGGLRGATVQQPLSMRAAPVAAGSYWPDAIARQRAAAADLSDGVRRGPWRARLSSLCLLARELYATPLLVWLLAPVLLGDGVAFSVDLWLAGALAALAAVLRWWSVRAVTGVQPSPRDDVLAALYHAPGSLGSWGAALRRRLRPVRIGGHARPLVWAALALTAVAAIGLLRHEPGRSASRAAVALSLLLLGALWALTVRSLVERNWSRAAFRVRLSLPARVQGVPARTLDGSPGGVALLGRFPHDRFAHGTEVQVHLDLDDGSTIEVDGVVAARRRRRGADLIGLELHPGASTSGTWAAQLLRASHSLPEGVEPRSARVDHHAPRRRAAVLLDRLVMGTVVVISVAVVLALTLVLAGYQPFVVRSGSMVPTYHVGDVVLVEQVPADQLRAGDVASLRYYPEYGESLTHRVRSVHDVGGNVRVETRGDANESSEVWTVTPDTMVGRVVASVPAIGAPATLVRTAVVPMVIGLLLLVVALAAVLGGHRLRRRAHGVAADTSIAPVDTRTTADDGDSSTADDTHDRGPAGPATLRG